MYLKNFCVEHKDADAAKKQSVLKVPCLMAFWSRPPHL